MGLGQALDGALDGPGHALAGPPGIRRRLAVPAAQAHGRRQLGDREVALLLSTVQPPGVVVGGRLLDLLLELPARAPRTTCAHGQ